LTSERQKIENNQRDNESLKQDAFQQRTTLEKELEKAKLEIQELQRQQTESINKHRRELKIIQDQCDQVKATCNNELQKADSVRMEAVEKAKRDFANDLSKTKASHEKIISQLEEEKQQLRSQLQDKTAKYEAVQAKLTHQDVPDGGRDTNSQKSRKPKNTAADDVKNQIESTNNSNANSNSNKKQVFKIISSSENEEDDGDLSDGMPEAPRSVVSASDIIIVPKQSVEKVRET